MDPVTHGLVGLTVASFSGTPISLTNPVYIGTLLGSLSPDFDFVLQAKGDLCYLRQHRGVSHSIPSSISLAGIIALPLYFIFPETSLWNLFIWTWLGALSHCVIDIFNSYGGELLWPFYRKKISINLFNIFDPYLFVILSAIIYFQQSLPVLRNLALFIGLIYLSFRYLARRKVWRLLNKKHKHHAKRILVMPALKGSWTWDVFVESKNCFIIGQISSFSLAFKLKQMLWKQQHKLIKAALESKLGKLFRDFTPLLHVSHKITEKGHLVEFYDLRYHFKQEFLHTGKAIFDEQHQLVEEVFSPYLGKRNINLAG